MQNIDPVYFLYPVVVIGITSGLILYWHFKRKFRLVILALSFIAYAGAIALKFIVQIPTINSFDSAVGGNSFALGIYYAIQTIIFEVGGAYIVAHYAVSRSKLKANDAEGYGLGLAFWENGVYLGVLTLINYLIYYALLSGSSGASTLLYGTLVSTSPGLFASPSVALVNVGFAILERISSILIHFSWGYLVLLSCIYKRKSFFAIALSMGLIDFFVPFAGKMGTALFETVIFLFSLGCLAVALKLTSAMRANQYLPIPPSEPEANST